jgi:hypothetical protein
MRPPHPAAKLAARWIEARTTREGLEIRPGEAMPLALLAELREHKSEMQRCQALVRSASKSSAVLIGACRHGETGSPRDIEYLRN